MKLKDLVFKELPKLKEGYRYVIWVVKEEYEEGEDKTNDLFVLEQKSQEKMWVREIDWDDKLEDIIASIKVDCEINKCLAKVVKTNV